MHENEKLKVELLYAAATVLILLPTQGNAVTCCIAACSTAAVIGALAHHQGQKA